MRLSVISAALALFCSLFLEMALGPDMTKDFVPKNPLPRSKCLPWFIGWMFEAA